jgi:hypothetical protein
MKKIQIFDPAMCCATGVCGPSIDPDLLRVSFVVSNLRKKKYPIDRYNLANDTDRFLDNSDVSGLLNEKGPGVLPVILVDGNVTMTGHYPSNEQFEAWTGIAASELSKKPIIHFSLNP